MRGIYDMGRPEKIDSRGSYEADFFSFACAISKRDAYGKATTILNHKQGFFIPLKKAN
jgi:hypothetical protein